MRVGTAEARSRFAELVERARRGEVVEIARRGEVVAVLTVPGPRAEAIDSFATWLEQWRAEWGVDELPDEDPWEGVRDPSPGRPPPW